MVKTIEELRKEATSYGIDFHPTIGATKLQERIDEHIKQAGIEALQQKSKEVQKPKEVQDETAIQDVKEVAKEKTLEEKVAEALKRAKSTRIVSIVDNDKRVNQENQMCTATCTNAYFDLGQRFFPLDEKIEIMQGHLDSLEEAKCTYMVADEKNNTTRVLERNRFTITYHDNLKPELEEAS